MMKYKRLIPLLLAGLCFLFAGCIVHESPEPTHAQYDTGERRLLDSQDLRGVSYAIYSDQTAEVFDLDADKIDATVVLAEEVRGCPVVGIAPEAFKGAKVTEVVLPESLVRIGDRAFQRSAVEVIRIPDGITEVGVDVFDNCKSLKSAVIGKGLTALPTGTFFSCDSLSEVTIPEGVRVIGEECFSDCAALTEISLPSSVTEIGAFAFYRSGLQTIAIPHGVAAIGAGAFRETEYFRAATEEFTVVGDGVLIRYNGEETSVVIPDGVRFLSDAFTGTAVTEVEIPNGVADACRDVFADSRVAIVHYTGESDVLKALAS